MVPTASAGSTPTNSVTDTVTTVVGDASVIAGGVSALENILNGQGATPVTLPTVGASAPAAGNGSALPLELLLLAAVALGLIFFFRRS